MSVPHDQNPRPFGSAKEGSVYAPQVSSLAQTRPIGIVILYTVTKPMPEQFVSRSAIPFAGCRKL